MAASAITIEAVSLAGLKPTYAAANAEGNFFLNSGKEFLHVKNGHTSPQTVTIDSPTTCNQGSTHDVAVAIPASEERMIGPFPKDRFNDASGYVQITYSGVTALTVRAITVS